MKKLEKLELNKKTVTVFEKDHMKMVKGGDSTTACMSDAVTEVVTDYYSYWAGFDVSLKAADSYVVCQNR